MNPPNPTRGRCRATHLSRCCAEAADAKPNPRRTREPRTLHSLLQHPLLSAHHRVASSANCPLIFWYGIGIAAGARARAPKQECSPRAAARGRPHRRLPRSRHSHRRSRVPSATSPSQRSANCERQSPSHRRCKNTFGRKLGRPSARYNLQAAGRCFVKKRYSVAASGPRLQRTSTADSASQAGPTRLGASAGLTDTLANGSKAHAPWIY